MYIDIYSKLCRRIRNTNRLVHTSPRSTRQSNSEDKELVVHILPSIKGHTERNSMLTDKVIIRLLDIVVSINLQKGMIKKHVRL